MPDINAKQAFEEIYRRRTPRPIRPYSAAEHQRRLEGLENNEPPIQYERDVAFWYGTLMQGAGPGEQNRWKTELLKRMWGIIWFGGLWMKHNNTWYPWGHGDLPIACCLSHGGRVLVEVPDDRVWIWLWEGHPPETRKGATHDVQFGDFEKMPDDLRKQVKEIKVHKLIADPIHFGVNIAGGGVNEVHPISVTHITDDGRYGHLYICYRRPLPPKVGAIMFGVEDCAPVDRAVKKTHQKVAQYVLLPAEILIFPVGIATLVDAATTSGHKPLSGPFFPKGQMGAYHGLGGSGTWSVTGGQKFKNMRGQKVPQGDDSMYVNPPHTVWDGLIAGHMRFEAEFLGLCRPPSTIEMPLKSDFQRMTNDGVFHIRKNHLKQMDKIVEAYHVSRDERILSNFIMCGEDYEQFCISNPKQADSPRVRHEVRRNVELARKLLWQMPLKEDFKKMTDGGSLHKRNRLLVEMDNFLEDYHRTGDRQYLRDFIARGENYANTVTSDPQRVKSQVKKNVELAKKLMGR